MRGGSRLGLLFDVKMGSTTRRKFVAVWIELAGTVA
jgi:hypothetical protein